MAFHTKREHRSQQNKPYPQQPIPIIKGKKGESRGNIAHGRADARRRGDKTARESKPERFLGRGQ